MMNKDERFEAHWRSPSNIALIKYWGKKKNQIPQNPSISFTLQDAYTQTRVVCERSGSSNNAVSLYLDNELNEDFGVRIAKLLFSWKKTFKHVYNAGIEIHTHNSFPHSTGIASSASGMSALVKCIISLEIAMGGDKELGAVESVSSFARLASGSACRSVIPYWGLWGNTEGIEGSNDFYAVGVEGLDDRFKAYHDDVIIISSEKKSVSSSAGHRLMVGNRYAASRYKQARHHMSELLLAMKLYDLDRFCEIVEQEAMELHALMMCSSPSYILLKPKTLEAIDRIREMRRESGIPVCFTLDAGPNIHLLYPDEYKEKLSLFIEEQLRPLAVDGRIINDHVGAGPMAIRGSFETKD